MDKWEKNRAKLIFQKSRAGIREAIKTNPYIIPALIIAAAILVGSWMVVQSNKAEAEKAARQKILIELRQRMMQGQLQYIEDEVYFNRLRDMELDF